MKQALLISVLSLCAASAFASNVTSAQQRGPFGYVPPPSYSEVKATPRIAPLAGTASGWISAGAAADGAVSVAVGLKAFENWAFELGAVFNGDYKNTEVSKNAVGHENYVSLGKKQIGEAVGIDALYVFNPKSRIQVMAGGGVYFADRREVALSNQTGRKFTQERKEQLIPAAAGAVHFYPTGSWMLGAGVHTTRGVSMFVGNRF